MFERILLSECASILGYKVRSAKRWLAKHGVSILCDDGTNKKKYVLRWEFEQAKNKVAVTYLIKKYGTENVPDIIKANIGLHTEIFGFPEQPTPQKKYTPKSKHEAEFLQRLQTVTKTLIL